MNDKQVFMPVSVMELQKKLQENKTRKALYPEKQEQLRKLFSGMQPTDNPVIMVVTLKE